MAGCGTVGGYTNGGCRCPACVKAHREHHAAYRAALRARTAAGDPAVPHGTPGGYHNWGCRCPPCTAAAADGAALARARRKLLAGRPLTGRDTGMLARAGHDLPGLAS